MLVKPEQANFRFTVQPANSVRCQVAGLIRQEKRQRRARIGSGMSTEVIEPDQGERKKRRLIRTAGASESGYLLMAANQASAGKHGRKRAPQIHRRSQRGDFPAWKLPA